MDPFRFSIKYLVGICLMFEFKAADRLVATPSAFFIPRYTFFVTTTLSNQYSFPNPRKIRYPAVYDRFAFVTHRDSKSNNIGSDIYIIPRKLSNDSWNGIMSKSNKQARPTDS